MASNYTEILNELNRDVANAKPMDVLQYCANWFQTRLAEQRATARMTAGLAGFSGQPAESSETTNVGTPAAFGVPAASSSSPATSAFINRRPKMNMPIPQSNFAAANEHTKSPKNSFPLAQYNKLYETSEPSPFSESLPSNSPFAPSSSTTSQAHRPTSLLARSAPSSAAFASDKNVSDHPLFNTASPFGVTTDSTPGALQPSSATTDRMDDISPSINLGRRTSVSAESLMPVSTDDAQAVKVIIPKSDEQRKRIEAAIAPNFLFRHLDEEQHIDVVNAMEEMHASADERIIEQGGVGDYFYVVEEGELDVYVRGPDDPLTTMGTKVHHYTNGGSFGELALMYNAPRAASIITISPCTLWRLDRITFRSILLEHTSRKRKLYENLFSMVPILVGLMPTERTKVADALESRTYECGDDIIKQGDPGSEFFIIESGYAKIIKDQRVVGYLGPGDYFGELALLNAAPRAATIKVCEASELPAEALPVAANLDPESTPKNFGTKSTFTNSSGRMKVAALQEKAFSRLLGPVHDIMKRQEQKYIQS